MRLGSPRVAGRGLQAEGRVGRTWSAAMRAKWPSVHSAQSSPRSCLSSEMVRVRVRGRVRVRVRVRAGVRVRVSVAVVPVERDGEG